MTNLLVPSHVKRSYVPRFSNGGDLPAVPAAALSTDLFFTDASVAAQVANLGAFPTPRGHKVAVLMVLPPDRIGSFVIPDEYREKKGRATTTGVVVGLGPAAYQDKERFPDGPYCRLGEVVVFPKYAGQPISVPGKDGQPVALTFLNDDEIVAGWGDFSVQAGDEADLAEPPAGTSGDHARDGGKL